MIKRILLRMLRWLAGPNPELVSEKLGNKTVSVYRGTIRGGIDKDDAWFVYLVRNSSNIFDIGCNIGLSSLLANIFGHPREIILVDPNPQALSIAAGNLIRNGYAGGARFVPAFVSNESKAEVKFYTIGSGAAGSIYPEHAKSAAQKDSWYMVPTKTVDELVKQTGVTPDLIKIDVEGAEGEVLQGALEICKTAKPKIMVEMHSNTNMTMKENAAKILTWCSEAQYRAWYLKEGAELSTAETIAHRGRCHLLLLPKESGYPDYLRGVGEGASLPQ